MAYNVSQKLIKDHLVSGEMIPGLEIGEKIDQTLTQDATGTMVMLELEAMQLDRAKTEVSAQYVDHNIIQEDSKNPDDHLLRDLTKDGHIECLLAAGARLQQAGCNGCIVIKRILKPNQL